MSNHQASATITATLQRILEAAVQIDLSAAKVTTVRPDAGNNKLPEVGINIYMCQAINNPAWVNVDLGNRRSKGDLAKQTQIGLDLHYILTYYGNEEELEPERLMCSSMRAMIDNAVLFPETIQQTIRDPKYAYLADSNLDQQIEKVKIMPSKMNFEEFSKIWSAYFQPPRALSFAFVVSAILVEGNKSGNRALPVRGIATYSAPDQPRILQVLSDTGANQPFMATSKLTIRGTQLDANASDKLKEYNSDPKVRRKPLDRGKPQVKIGEMRVTPQSITDTEIELDLSQIKPEERNALRAGVQSLQVVYPVLPVRAPSQPERIVSSNTMPFVLCPTIKEVQVKELQHEADNFYTANVQAFIDVIVGASQKVSLILNERSQHNPDSYIFVANPRFEDTFELVFSIRDVKAGEYLARIQIDGAESPLEVDTNPESKTFEQYVRPVVVIG